MTFPTLQTVRLRTLAALLLTASCLAVGAVRAAVVATPAVVVNSLTHTYSPGASFPFPQPAFSRDSFSIGDGNYTGGGAFSVPSISNGDTATVRVQAPAGMKFVVHDASALLSLNLFWQSGGDALSLAGGTVAFENLSGATPPTTYAFLGVGNGGNVIKAELQFSPAGLIEFTALNITIPVQSSPPGGTRNFGSVQSNSSLAFYARATGSTNHTVMSLQPVAVPEAGAWLLVGVIAAGTGLAKRFRPA